MTEIAPVRIVAQEGVTNAACLLERRFGQVKLDGDLLQSAVCPRRDYLLHTNGVDIIRVYIDGCRAKGDSRQGEVVPAGLDLRAVRRKSENLTGFLKSCEFAHFSPLKSCNFSIVSPLKS